MPPFCRAKHELCDHGRSTECISRACHSCPPQKALHLRSLRTFTDDFGVVRKNGEEWLIKMSDTEMHIPSVYEEVSDPLSQVEFSFWFFENFLCPAVSWNKVSLCYWLPKFIWQ